MRRVFRSFLVISATAGAMFGIAGGAGIAQASTTQASTTTQASLTAAVSPAPAHAGLASPLNPQQTEPPGACDRTKKVRSRLARTAISTSASMWKARATTGCLSDLHVILWRLVTRLPR